MSGRGNYTQCEFSWWWQTLPAREKRGSDRNGLMCLTEWHPPKTFYRLQSMIYYMPWQRFLGQSKWFFKPYSGAKLTTLIGSIHGMYFLIAPGNQDLNESVFISPSPLGKKASVSFIFCYFGACCFFFVFFKEIGFLTLCWLLYVWDPAR